MLFDSAGMSSESLDASCSLWTFSGYWKVCCILMGVFCRVDGGLGELFWRTYARPLVYVLLDLDHALNGSVEVGYACGNAVGFWDVVGCPVRVRFLPALFGHLSISQNDAAF